MRGKRGFPGTGAVVAGTVACGVLATPGVAFATPPPSPPPTPRPVQSSAQTSVGGESGRPVAEGSVAGSSVAESRASGGAVAGGSSSLSAYPSLGHFGVAVGRPLRGRITLANPTGGRLAFRLVDPTLLPAGITLDADGLLGGASRVSGTWTVPVQACVPSGGCATGTVTITITCECARSLPPSPSLTGAPCSAGDVVTE